MQDRQGHTGYPSIDKPWLKYYTKQTLNIPSPDMNMYEFLRENVKENLGYTALNYYGTKVTYKELFQNIDKVAVSLHALGVRKGEIVTLCALNTPEFVYLLYALNKIGAVSNWVGLTSPEADLREQIVSTESRFVFTVNIAYEQMAKATQNSEVEKIISIPIEYSMPTGLRFVVGVKNRHIKIKGMEWKEFLNCVDKDKLDEEIINPDDVAIIEYTGGSTGVPKGVMLSNKALNSYYVNFADVNTNEITHFEKKDKFLCCVPLFLAFGASTCCHGALCHSQELILAPDPNPEAVTTIIIRLRVNHIIAGRLLIEGLLEKSGESKMNLSFIHSVMYGGEETNKIWEHSMTRALKNKKADVSFLNGYGMTETSAAILVAPNNEVDGLIPYANVNVKIVDPEDGSIEYGYDTEGELCISSDQLMLGYFENVEETNNVIIVEDGVRWIKTHDLAKISSDGIIKITGRIKRIYSRLTSDKIQVRVYPMRIEEVLRKNDLVHECAVVGVKDDSIAYRSVAYIVLEDKAEELKQVEAQLVDYCHNNLPDSHWPDEYVFVDEFPITRAGKVDYLELTKRSQK